MYNGTACACQSEFCGKECLERFIFSPDNEAEVPFHLALHPLSDAHGSKFPGGIKFVAGNLGT